MGELEDLKARLRKFLLDRDWEKFHNPRDLAISICLEAAELLEVFQWKEHIKSNELIKDDKTFNKIKEELADVFIYSLGLANNLNLNVKEIIENKIKKNKEKYPADKVKGSARKYTEYN